MIPALLTLAVLAADPSPKTGLLSEQPLAGGWRVGSSANAKDVRIASAHSASGRTVLAVAVRNAAGGFDGTEARIVGPDGKTVRTMEMKGMLPSQAAISRDGRIAAVIASRADDPNAEYSLLVFDDKGTKLFRKDVDPAYEVLAGETWIALWAHAPLPGAIEEEEGAPLPAQAAEPTLVYDLGGRVMHPGEPLGGSLCRLGDSLASTTPGRFVLWRANLTRRGRADVDTRAGVPFCASEGSLVAIGDFEFDEERLERTLQLFDGASAKKTGTITMDAPLGIDAAIAPDGSAVVATAAAPDIAGDVLFEAPLEVAIADRTGATRARFVTDRRHPTERAILLATSNGGKRTAFLRRTSDPAEDRITLLDAAGAVLWETDRPAAGLALDASGEWLTILDATGVTRLRVSRLTKLPKTE